MFRKSDKRIWACLKTVKDKWFFTGGWRRIPQSVTHFSNIMAVLVPLWQSSLLICIRITVVTCNHAGLSHLVYPINSRCADVDRQPLVHIHTRTWQNLKKTDKVQKSGYIPRLSFLAFLIFSACSWSVYSSSIKFEWKRFTDSDSQRVWRKIICKLF